jgi:hypothetical protein
MEYPLIFFSFAGIHELTQTQTIAFFSKKVAGHEGKLVFGNLGNQYVICMVGRFHPCTLTIL